MYRNLAPETIQFFDAASRDVIGKVPPVDSNQPITGSSRGKEIRQEIRDLLEAEPEHGMPSEAMFRLRKILEIAQVLGTSHEDQWQVLYETYEALGDARAIVPFSEIETWKEAFELANNSLSERSYRHAGRGGGRAEHVGRAFLALKRKGFPHRIDGRGVSLTECSYFALCARIEKKIKRVGGEHVANATLDFMKRLGRVEDGSLLHARTPTTWQGKRETGTPWHFIYSLATKYLNVRPTANNSEPILEEMEKLAVWLAAALDVEPHSSYENMSLYPASVIGVLYDTVIYDELFAIPQWQPLAGKTIVPMWLRALEAEGCQFPNANANEWVTFGECLMSLAAEAALRPIGSSDLHIKGWAASKVKKLFLLIAGPTSGVNVKFRTPSDTQHRDANMYPILAGVDGRYLLQPKSVVGRAFCERLYTLMREKTNPDLENKMGMALERLTKDVLSGVGYKPSICGEFYRNAITKKKQEIDLVVETEERIFLIECTKKTLTSRARGGHTLDGLRDLSKSFLKLIRQLSEHEAHLRQEGNIEFQNGQTLTLNGRSVEKIALSLFDHGSLQNRDVTMGLIEALVNSQMSTDEPDKDNTAKGVNEALTKLNAALQAIIAINTEDNERRLFRFAMSTWWLSIDQLQYLAIKEGDLWTTMQRVRHMTARSGDLVAEIRQAMDLNDVGKAMFDATIRMDNRGYM